MPIDKQKLELILADPDFMSLPETEQDSFLDELSNNKQNFKAPDLAKAGAPFTDIRKMAVPGLASFESGNILADESKEGLIKPLLRRLGADKLIGKLSPKKVPTVSTQNIANLGGPITGLVGRAMGATDKPMEVSAQDVGEGVLDVVSDPRSYVPVGASKPVQSGAKAVGKAAGRVIEPITSIPSKIGKVERAVGEVITPKASKSIFKNTVGLPDEEVSRISGTYKGSVAPIVDRVKGGLRSKVDQSEELFRKIVEDAPEDATLNVKDFKNYVGKVLRQNGIIDESGKRIPGIGKDNKVLNSLYDIHQDLKKRVKLNKPDRLKEIINREPDLSKEAWTMTRENEGLLNEAARFTDEIDKGQYFRLKQNLQSLLTGDDAIDRNTYSLIENLDDSISQSTIPGLKEAKGAYKSAKEFEGRYLNRNTGELKFGESKLERLGTQNDLPEVEIKSLRELENYIDSPFVDETSKINKIREFEGKYTPTKIEDDLTKFQKGEKYNFMQNLKSLMGDDAAEIEGLLNKNKTHKKVLSVAGKGAIAGAGTIGIGALIKTLLGRKD